MDMAVENSESSRLWGQIAATYAFLSQVANTAPSKESVADLMDAVHVASSDKDARGVGGMKRYVDERADVPLEQVVQELAVDWTLLFRGINRQTGPKPPYAGVWLSGDGVGVAEMCSVNRHYVEAGLGAGGTAGNRLDYFGIELEFVARMARRITEGDAQAPSLLAAFLDTSLLPWFGSFVQEAKEKGSTMFWKGYLELAEDSLDELRALLPA